MINFNREIMKPYALFSSIVVTVVGVGIFSYPRELALSVGPEGWIVTIFGGIAAYILLYITYKAIKANNYNKFHTMVEYNFGKIIGGVICLIFIFFNIFIVGFGMRIFVEVVKMYLLEKTPTEFILIVTILTATYLIRGEVDALIKFNEIAFWIMFIPITIVLIFTLNNTDFTNIFPILNHTPFDYISALKTSVYSFAGFEVIYLFLPIAKNKCSIPKTALKSIIFVTIFYILAVVFSLAVFGKEQSKILLWPTITMIKSIDIPGAFVERWEGVVMAMWIIFYFTTFSNLYYLSADITKDLFRLKDIKLSSIFVSPFVYLMALYPVNIAELYDLENKILPVYFISVLVVLPLLLFLIGLRKNKKRGGVNNEI